MRALLYATIVCLLLTSCDEIDYTNIAPIEEVSGGTIFGTETHPLNVGGPSQPNQVYIGLSNETATAVPRESWDLGFYCGDGFKVFLNGSVMMAAKQLDITDMSLILQPDYAVAVGTFNPDNMNYVDNPNGSIESTAFGEIATTESTAKVYMLNMGNKVPENIPAAGAVNTAGEARGWMKIKVWQNGNGYIMQYAALEATVPNQVNIAKDAAYNCTFFSLTEGTVVSAEPKKDMWDIAFTTFTNEVFDGTASAGAYFYADYVITNSKAGVTAVKINGNDTDFAALTLSAFTAGNYILESDQRAIGADWRDVFNHNVYEDVFFVVKSSNNNALYKLKFISMVSTDGERGYPVFQYELLQ